MRQIVLFVSVLVLFCACIVNGAEPNFVKSTIKNVDGAATPHDVVSTSYSDGLGRAIQSKLQLNSGSMSGRARVVSSFFDNAGRPYLMTKPYVDLSTNPKDLFSPGDFNTINTILDNNDNYYNFKDGNPSAYAYSESEYYDDPLGRVKRAGAPGNDYRLGSGNHTAAWSFGVSVSAVPDIPLTVTGSAKTIKVLSGFLIAYNTSDLVNPIDLNDDILGALYTHLLQNPITGAGYFLSVARDPDGKISQELKDLFGRTIATRAGEDANPIIAGYEFDILGNVLLEHAPKKVDASTLISDSRYEYNTLGQLTRKESPDLFVEEMTYDNAGNIASKIVHGMNGKYDDFIITYNYDYDDMSRLKRIRTPQTNPYGWVGLAEYFYDNTDEFFTEAKSYGIPTAYFSNLENTQGRLVAEIAYNRPAGRRFYYGGQPALVVDVYSYDDEGRVKTKFKVIPGLPLQTINYTYDIHGKMETEEFICGTTTSKKFYKYNSDGNLKAVAHGNYSDDVLTYTYDPHGWIKSKDFSKLSGNKTLSYTYDIRDWLKISSFNGTKKFSQTLDYTTDLNNEDRGDDRIPANAQKSYNGNIRFSSLVYNDGGDDKVFDQSYSYDAVNRLETYKTYDESNVQSTDFSGSFGYDNAGRFSRKEEGTNINNLYEYYPLTTDPNLSKTCRLARAKTGGKIYIYDYKGNMIIDQSKNMYISYDWRNLPIKFDFYNTLPVGPDNSSKISPDDYGTMIITDNSYHSDDPTNYVDYIDWLRANDEIELLSSVQMYYDAAGKRVLKVEN